MPVVLSPELESLIVERVASGRYDDAESVVREALRLLERREHEVRIRASVDEGFAELERGEGAEFTPELRRELLASARRRALAGEQPDPDVIP